MGSATSEPPGESSFDLLERWLDGGREPAYDAPRRPTSPTRQGHAGSRAVATRDATVPVPAPRPSPECGGAAEPRERAGVAVSPATPVAPAAETIDLSIPDTGHRLGGVLLVAGTVLSLVATAAAMVEPTSTSVVLAATLTLATVLGRGLRAAHPPARVTLSGSRLEILRGGSRHVFDLASHQTPVDVIGVPGDRRWRVVFHRRSLAPFVLDAGMVDPAEFVRVLHLHRPEVSYLPRG